MVYPTLKSTIDNEDGMVTVFVLMILVILTVAGIVGINMSNNEANIVRNEQLAATDFYDAESGINDARINFNTWLTDAFLATGETAASSTLNSFATDKDGNPLATVQATVQVRCIENNAVDGSGNAVPTTIFNDVADEMPAMNHTAPPPTGSGYSVVNFETRRYSITSTSNSGRTVVQCGVWKVFNKY